MGTCRFFVGSRLVLIALFLIIASHASSAGTIRDIAVEVGPNYGFLAYDDPMEVWDSKWDAGITGGALITIPLSTHLSVVPEIRYSHLRNKVEFVNSIFEGNFSVEHNSICMPLLLRYEFAENMFFVDLGPEFALMLSSKLHSDYDDPIAGHINETEDVSDDLKGYNIGACGRVGFDARRWNIPIAISVAYHHGFIGVAEEDEWWSNWKTRELSMCLSYLYQFAR